MKKVDKRIARKEFEAGEVFYHLFEGLLQYVGHPDDNYIGYIVGLSPDLKPDGTIFCFVKSISDEGFDAFILFFGQALPAFVPFDKYFYKSSEYFRYV
jgi:hypothetical protein